MNFDEMLNRSEKTLSYLAFLLLVAGLASLSIVQHKSNDGNMLTEKSKLEVSLQKFEQLKSDLEALRTQFVSLTNELSQFTKVMERKKT